MISLASKSVGPPDNSFQWYLQCGGISLATGFNVGLGSGTETLLWLDANGIGFTNAAGFHTSFRCDATAHQTLSFHYTAGTGKVYPELMAVLAADASNSTVTPATVGSFSITLAASSVYEFEGVLVFTSAATGTGARFTVQGPSAQTDWVSYEAFTPASTGTLISAWGTAFSPGAAPVANTPYACPVRGICKTNGNTPAVAVTLDIFSEIGGSAITLKAGSFLKFRKIN
jgi:hypothetical protein